MSSLTPTVPVYAQADLRGTAPLLPVADLTR